jgi:hypothetical protein
MVAEGPQAIGSKSAGFTAQFAVAEEPRAPRRAPSYNQRQPRLICSGR